MGKLSAAPMSQDAWLDALLNLDLPVLSVTTFKLDCLLADEKTTSEQLAEAILSDIALTIRVIKIANTAQHIDTTTSRDGAVLSAIESIGFNGLRAICISSSWLTNKVCLLEDKPELVNAISSSFSTAVQARNLAKNSSLNAQNIYIAALLLNIGEIAFWFSSIPSSTEYTTLMRSDQRTPEEAFTLLTGNNFTEVSRLLAERWQLGELLLKSLNVESSPEVKFVLLGREISKAALLGWNSEPLHKILSSQLGAVQLNLTDAMELIKSGSREAQGFLNSYPRKQTLWQPAEKAEGV